MKRLTRNSSRSGEVRHQEKVFPNPDISKLKQSNEEKTMYEERDEMAKRINELEAELLK